jgi:hypothetical protein
VFEDQQKREEPRVSKYVAGEVFAWSEEAFAQARGGWPGRSRPGWGLRRGRGADGAGKEIERLLFQAYLTVRAAAAPRGAPGPQVRPAAGRTAVPG